jgi:hypothetical protein
MNYSLTANSAGASYGALPVSLVCRSQSSGQAEASLFADSAPAGSSERFASNYGIGPDASSPTAVTDQVQYAGQVPAGEMSGAATIADTALGSTSEHTATGTVLLVRTAGSTTISETVTFTITATPQAGTPPEGGGIADCTVTAQIVAS